MSQQAQSLRVFISYARRDASVFAEELLAGLEVAGFDPFLDRHDIAGGEDWEARLDGLIKAADTVVFVLTPASAASERCAWEVARAAGHSKRILPVVLIEPPADSIPATLQRLNYIYFTEGHSFARSLGDLARALRTDLDWVREHTRLAEIAQRWRDRDRADVLLLRGAELDAAKAWLSGWKTGAPEPSDLHRSLISESEAAEQTRNNSERKRLEDMAAAQAARQEALERLSRRTTFGLFAAGGLAAGAAGLAYWGTDAERRVKLEQKRLKETEQREKASVAAAEKRTVEEGIRKAALRTDVVGQIVAYATSPGLEVADSDGAENSPYTRFVLDELKDADSPLITALMRAHAKVPEMAAQMGLRQRPYLATDANADIYMLQQPDIRRRRALCISMTRTGNGGIIGDAGEKDTRAWADFLKRCGFDVALLHNPTLAQAFEAVEALNFPEKPVEHGWAPAPGPRIERAGFSPTPTDKKAPDNTFLFFYYSGGGCTLKYQDSLVMYDTEVDYDPQNPKVSHTLDLGVLLGMLRERAAISAAVLDAPFNRLDNLKDQA